MPGEKSDPNQMDAEKDEQDAPEPQEEVNNENRELKEVPPFRNGIWNHSVGDSQEMIDKTRRKSEFFKATIEQTLSSIRKSIKHIKDSEEKLK